MTDHSMTCIHLWERMNIGRGAGYYSCAKTGDQNPDCDICDEYEEDRGMNLDQWRREILYHCEDISIVDRDFARCRDEKPYPQPTHDCCFEKCPKRNTTSNETSR